MQRRKNSAWLAFLGAAILFAGLGGMLWSIERGMTDEELLARLDTGEQGFFEPVSAQGGLPTPAVEATDPSSAPTVVVYLPDVLSGQVNTPTAAPAAEPTATAAPSPTPQPTHAPEIPTGIQIPAIELDAPIAAVEPETLFVEGQEYYQWTSPDEFAAGWHVTSALLNERGNLVLNGHNNIYGSVFKRLEELVEGDILYIQSASGVQMYIVANKMILEERGQPLEVRIANSGWLQPTDDQRLTLVTCWPLESNTHRLIIVAVPYP